MGYKICIESFLSNCSKWHAWYFRAFAEMSVEILNLESTVNSDLYSVRFVLCPFLSLFFNLWMKRRYWPSPKTCTNVPFEALSQLVVYYSNIAINEILQQWRWRSSICAFPFWSHQAVCSWFVSNSSYSSFSPVFQQDASIYCISLLTPILACHAMGYQNMAVP